MEPQVIRRRCSADLFDAVAAGTRTFDIRLDTEGVEVDDYYVFTDDSEPEPREVYRRVAYVTRTKDLDATMQEKALRDGFTVIGFYPTEYFPLGSVLMDNSFLVAYAIEKHFGEIKMIAGPTYLPLNAGIEVDMNQLHEHLQVEKWPEGQYSIMLRCQSAEPDETTAGLYVYVPEKIVLIRTHTDDGEKLMPANWLALTTGVAQNLVGSAIQPSFGLTEEDET